MDRTSAIIKKVYYDAKQPGSFSGVSKLHRNPIIQKHKITRHAIRQWLKSQETATMHKGVRRKIKRNRVLVSSLFQQGDTDLADMSNVSKENDGYKYLLIVIDVLSKKLYIEPLKTKNSEGMVNAFKLLLNRSPHFRSLRSDAGTEYTNQALQNLFKHKKINHFVTTNPETKANLAERVIKTIKSKIYKYFSQNQTHRYIDVLKDLVSSYNNTYHRSIKMPPVDAQKANEWQVWKNLYIDPLINNKGTSKTRKKLLLKPGDVVRLSHLRNIFQRDYQEKWTGEHFYITEAIMRDGIPVYKVKDYAGDDITGTFYSAELQHIKPSDTQHYKIEKILARRTEKGKPQVLIKWLNWPTKYNSWLDKTQVENYRKTK
jgi:hypothetical protein